MTTPSTTESTIALFELYPVLSGIRKELRERLSSELQTVQVQTGTVLFDETQPCLGFPFLLHGSIRVIKTSDNGRELPLYRVFPGESCIVSSSCLLGHAEYNARGIADGDTTLVVVPRPLFDELLEESTFRDFVFQLFSERIADLMRLVEEVAFQRLDQRLAALLLGKGRVVRTTHQHLADELGSVREMVSRLLKVFSEQNLVSLGREQIEILDPAKLRELAGGKR